MVIYFSNQKEIGKNACTSYQFSRYLPIYLLMPVTTFLSKKFFIRIEGCISRENLIKKRQIYNKITFCMFNLKCNRPTIGGNGTAVWQ